MTGELTAPYTTTHNCLDFLVLRESYTLETHGLDCGPYEYFRDEWNECTVCHEKYTHAEVQKMWDDEAPALDLEDRLQEADDALGVC